MAKNLPNQHNRPFVAQRAKKNMAEGRSPPQELEESQHSGIYLLVKVNGLYDYSRAYKVQHSIGNS